MFDPCQTISSQIGREFSCRPIGKYVRITTPFVYPDGDCIALFYRDTEAQPALSDLGETIRWLSTQRLSSGFSKKQSAMIEEIASGFGVHFSKGTLSIKDVTPSCLTDATIRLSQAALRVSDVCFTFRLGHVENMKDDVAEFLTEHGVAYERNKRFTGRGGRQWVVDFETKTKSRHGLVVVLNALNRGASRGVFAQTVTTWFELRDLKGQNGNSTEFISLFNDTVDVWHEGDYEALSELSRVSRWSDADSFLELVA